MIDFVAVACRSVKTVDHTYWYIIDSVICSIGVIFYIFFSNIFMCMGCEFSISKLVTYRSTSLRWKCDKIYFWHETFLMSLLANDQGTSGSHKNDLAGRFYPRATSLHFSARKLFVTGEKWLLYYWSSLRVIIIIIVLNACRVVSLQRSDQMISTTHRGVQFIKALSTHKNIRFCECILFRSSISGYTPRDRRTNISTGSPWYIPRQI